MNSCQSNNTLKQSASNEQMPLKGLINLKLMRREMCEDSFVYLLRENAAVADIFLINGIKLTGKVVYYDKETIIISDSNENPMLIYKANITSIKPIY